jgi:hypothetical protein
MADRAGDTTLTLATLEAALRTPGVASDAADFWAAVRRRFGVLKVTFSSYLPDDHSAYVLAAVPSLGTVRTLVIPERWRRDLPPLPSVLDLHTHGAVEESHRAP